MRSGDRRDAAEKRARERRWWRKRPKDPSSNAACLHQAEDRPDRKDGSRLKWGRGVEGEVGIGGREEVTCTIVNKDASAETR